MATGRKGQGGPAGHHARNLKILSRELLELEKRQFVALRGDRVYITPLGELQAQRRVNGMQIPRALDLDGRATSADGGSSPPARSNGRPTAEDIAERAHAAIARRRGAS